MVGKHKAQLKKLDCDAGDNYNFSNNSNFIFHQVKTVLVR